MNNIGIKLKVKNFRAAKEAEIEIGKAILYGPNGGGKSSAIHALLIFLTGDVDPLDTKRHLHYGSREGTEIEVCYDRDGRCDRYNYLKIEDLKGNFEKIRATCSIDGKEMSTDSLDKFKECSKHFWNNAGINNIGYIRGDRLTTFYPGEIKPVIFRDEHGEKDINIEIEDIEDFARWQELTSYYKIIDHSIRVRISKERSEERTLGGLILDTIGGTAIYNGYIYGYEEETWYPLHLGAYGHRRAVMFLYALAFSDIVIVEGFDNAFHIDLMVKLLDLADSLDKRIVIETHVGLLTLWFLRKGWKPYYLEKGKSIRIDADTIESVALFKRERDIYYGRYG